MTEFNANDSEGTLDFFILSGFDAGPQSVSEIGQRVQWAERLLVIAAARNRKLGPGSLSAALQRLEHEGYLKPERTDEPSGLDKAYSLTHAGRQRLEQERARRHRLVSEFVEDSEMEGSFRRFLNRTGPLWPH